MKDQSDYVVIVGLESVTLTSRVITAPNASTAIARATLELSPGEEDPIRDGEILSVRVYKCIAISEEFDYAF